MYGVSAHGKQRLRERIGVKASDAEAIFAKLWRVARDATEVDLKRFCWMQREPDREYRIAVHKGETLLLVGSNDQLITIITE